LFALHIVGKKNSLLLLIVITSVFNCAAQTLRVVTEDLAPYQIVVNDEVVGGRSFLLVEELLKRAGIDSPVEVLPWARAFAIASSEPNVMIFSMARTANREANFNWLLRLDRHTYNFYSLATRPELQIQSLSEALQYTVATVRNSSEASSLLEMGFVEDENLILTLSYKEARQMVILKRADFTYANFLIQDAIYDNQASEPVLFFKGYNPGQSSDLYLATSLNTDADILFKLETSLQSMQQDGALAKLLPRLD
jgi:polar amino acid transport system substrate-binding protein